MREQKLYDPIRNLCLKQAPEEIIRQKTLQLMLQMGYPKHLLAVEKPLSKLVIFSNIKMPNRKVDIVCFSKNKPSPFVIVECKAHKINKKAIDQVIGYNRLIQAPYIVLSGSDKIMTGSWNDQTLQYEFMDRLPSFDEISG